MKLSLGSCELAHKIRKLTLQAEKLRMQCSELFCIRTRGARGSGARHLCSVRDLPTELDEVELIALPSNMERYLLDWVHVGVAADTSVCVTNTLQQGSWDDLKVESAF